MEQALREGVERISILFVDPETAERHLPSLRTRYEVSVVSSADQAVRALRTFRPTLVITELALHDGDGVDICRQSKSFGAFSPWVLATTAAHERVAEALLAGCDSVLLKPYAPALLHTRIGRLLRQQFPTHTLSSDSFCPSCGLGNVVGFDSSGQHRVWYSCLRCRNVWVGAGPLHGLGDGSRLNANSSRSGFGTL
jgi:CheY-like chemotaxis protein